MLVLGFGLGAVAMRVARSDDDAAASAGSQARVEDAIRTELGN
jgi:hypothetical protein